MTDKRTGPSCPMDALLRIISGPWTTYILWKLTQNKTLRFGELKRQVPGISSRVLTERLRKLEDAGLVFRDYEPTIPPKVSYGLTDQGQDFRTILNDLSALSFKLGLADPEKYSCNAGGSPEPHSPASECRRNMPQFSEH